jgi:hypothetical protein
MVWKGGISVPGKCIDCGKQLKLYTAKRCNSCAMKERFRISPNPMLGRKMTAEQRMINSLSKRGLVKSPEHRRNLSEALKGRILSEEHKYNLSKSMSKSQKGRKITWGVSISKSLMGKKKSEEACENMSKAHAGVPLSKKHREGLRRAMLGRKITWSQKISKSLIGYQKSSEHCRKIGIALTGAKSPNWRGGKSFEPYPLGWNKTHKEQIRYRDGYRCQLCGVPEIETGRKLDVHHIDYDKNNIEAENLTSLCKGCHAKTNHNRERWTEFFGKITGESKALAVSYV